METIAAADGQQARSMQRAAKALELLLPVRALLRSWGDGPTAAADGESTLHPGSIVPRDALSAYIDVSAACAELRAVLIAAGVGVQNPLLVAAAADSDAASRKEDPALTVAAPTPHTSINAEATAQEEVFTHTRDEAPPDSVPLALVPALEPQQECRAQVLRLTRGAHPASQLLPGVGLGPSWLVTGVAGRGISADDFPVAGLMLTNLVRGSGRAAIRLIPVADVVEELQRGGALTASGPGPAAQCVRWIKAAHGRVSAAIDAFHTSHGVAAPTEHNIDLVAVHFDDVALPLELLAEAARLDVTASTPGRPASATRTPTRHAGDADASLLVQYRGIDGDLSLPGARMGGGDWQLSVKRGNVERGAFTPAPSSPARDASRSYMARRKLDWRCDGVPGVFAWLKRNAHPVHVTYSSRDARCNALELLVLPERVADMERPVSRGRTDLSLVPPSLPYFATADQPDAWVQYDFGGVVVALTGYALCSHHPMLQGAALRNWRLEGTLDGVTWWELRTHRDDSTINGQAGNFGIWPLACAGRVGSPYLPALSTAPPFDELVDPLVTAVRVVATGPNAAGTRQLQLAALELYGRVMHCSVPRVSSDGAPAAEVDKFGGHDGNMSTRSVALDHSAPGVGPKGARVAPEPKAVIAGVAGSGGDAKKKKK